MSHDLTPPDPWTQLRTLTSARLAIGRTGRSLPTREVLQFSLAHAQARDAVHVPLDADELQREVESLGCATLRVASAAPDRATYLLRPDLGRRLSDDSAAALDALPDAARGCDLLVVIGDGLSSLAVRRNASALVAQIRAQAPVGWTLGPVVIATQARVALGDPIGERLRARHVAMLIGERPGLGAADSLGIYLTAAPRNGRLDAQRNCISNVRDGGLAAHEAARKLWWLCRAAAQLGATGVALKDLSDTPDALT